MLICMLNKNTKGKYFNWPSITRFVITYLTLSCFNDDKRDLMNLLTYEDWNASRFESKKRGKKWHI